MKISSKLRATLCGAIAALMIFSVIPISAAEVASSGEAGISAVSEYNLLDNDKFLEYPTGRINAQASQSQSGYPASNMLDSNTNSTWQAPWSGSTPPYELTFTLQDVEYVSGFMYTSRQDKNTDGMMSTYKVFATTGDSFPSDPIIEGNFIKRTATEFVYFDEPIEAKKIKVVTDAGAVAEMRIGYIPSTANDYDRLLAELAAYRKDVVQSGEDKGLWRPAYLDQFDAALELITEAGKPEDAVELYKANRTLVGLTSDLKRNQLAFTIELGQKLKNAQTIFYSALPGTDPLKWPQEAIDEFKAVIDEAEEVSESTAYAKGYIDDMDNRLDYSMFIFKMKQNKPEITFTGSTSKPLDYMLDGLTESHFQASKTGEGVYIGLDYKHPIRFENITFKTWFATGQAVTQVKIQYLDENNEWLWADNGKTFTMNWTTNNNVSEVQTIAFDEAIRSSALRIHIMAAKSANYVIDELIPGIAVDEADVTISLDKSALLLEEGENVQLNATVLPSYSSNKNVIWTSSQPEWVAVDGTGLVRAIKVPDGESTVTVNITTTTEYGGKSAICTVTVVPKKITEEDKENTIIRWNNANKLANAPKTSENYPAEAIAVFKTALEDIQEKLANPYITLGLLDELNVEIAQAVEAFEHTSTLSAKEMKNLIDRVTGKNSSDKFQIELIGKDSSTGMDVYEVDWKDGKPVLRGNNMVSLASAFNYYLKYYAYLDFPYVGESRLQLPADLPEVPEKVRIVFPYQYRHYFNENCEYKYTTTLYGMMEWQHRLDWLAMNGFNMFLMDAGDYAIWADAAVELGFADNAEAMRELRSSSKDSNSYMGKYTMSEDALKRDGEIAKFITETAFKLGLEPEIRPFSGLVPFMFPNNHDQYYGEKFIGNMTIDLPGSVFDGMFLYAGARWFNLPQGVYISPETAANVSDQKKAEMKEKFTQVAQTYYNSLMKVTGFDEYGRVPKFGYKDLVGEQGFVVQNEAFPRKVLAEMNEEFDKVNPDSIWIQTSWRYSKWLTEYYKPGKLMFVDLKAENRPLWQSSDEFAGTPWLWSVLLNFGGNTGMDAGLGTVADKVIDAKNNSHYMKGVSISPEGGDTNPAFYALMAEMTWRSEAPDMDQWIKDYTKRRYGEENYAAAQKEIDKAWDLLHKTVYRDFLPSGIDGPSQTVINAAPKLTGALARYYGSNTKLYQANEIIPVWKAMLDAAGKMTDPNPQFFYDLVDITRQVLGDLSGDVYAKINPNFIAKNKEETMKYAQMMVDIANDMDEILATEKEFMLGTRLVRARNRGTADSDFAYFEKSERTFLTYWIMDKPDSGGLLDYSNRHLSGLMKDYYGKRWEVFLDALQLALDKGTSLDQNSVNETNSRNAVLFTEDRSIYPTVPVGNAVDISKRLYNEYQPLIQELYGAFDGSNDLPVDGMSAIAGSENPLTGSEGPANFVLDNNPSTIWHSKYAGDSYDHLWIAIDLNGEKTIDGLRYLPRQSGGVNGIITKYAIEISDDGGKTYKKAATGEWTSDRSWKQVNFEPVQATHVKLRAIKAESTSSLNFASAAEIRIVYSGDKPEEDVTKPEWPTGAALTASDVGKTSLSLAWVAATDDNGVTSYKIYKDGSELTTVLNNTMTYKVQDLRPGTTYTFKVEAGDDAGNWSTEGPSIRVTTESESSGGGWTPPLEPNPTTEPEDNNKPEQPSEPEKPAEPETPKVVLTDISNHWAKASIEKAIELGFVNGYGDETFKPNRNVTRAEFATMLARALKLEASDVQLSFADNKAIPAWSKPFIHAIAKAGFIVGYEDGTFRANKEITRTELAVIIVRSLGIEVNSDAKLEFDDADQVPLWARPYVATAVEAGLMQGYGNGKLNPNGLATRAEAITLILHMLDN